MPAVSDREYLRRSTGRDTAETQDEQMTGHLDDGPHPPPPPHPPARLVRPFGGRRYTTRTTLPARPARSEEGHQARQPSAGHAQGVPAFPAPLPGSHDYPAAAPAPDPPPLDVGPAKPYYGGGLAHGVPGEVHHGGRPAPAAREQLAARKTAAAAEDLDRAPDPVPVYLVTRGSGGRPLRRSVPRQVLVPAPGADPIILVPRNPHRRVVALLNESANPVRLTPDLVLSGGALLPASMTSYKDLEGQDDICAYQPAGNSGTAAISVIDTYDVPDGS